MNNKESFQDIIEESIDDLNADQSFEGTPLKKKERKRKRQSRSAKVYWFALGGVLAVAQIGLFVYFQATRPVTVDAASGAVEHQQVLNQIPASLPERERVMLRGVFSGSTSRDVDEFFKLIKGLHQNAEAPAPRLNQPPSTPNKP